MTLAVVMGPIAATKLVPVAVTLKMGLPGDHLPYPRDFLVKKLRTFNEDEQSEAWERSEEHTSELQSLMRISYAVFCLKKKKIKIYLDLRYNVDTPRKQSYMLYQYSSIIACISIL